MTQTYKVQVSMNQAHIVESGFVWKQGDFGFNIEIEVLDFDTTGATPQIIFRKSTGAVEATQITRDGNKFTYAIRGTELDTPGPCVCDLKLNDSTTKRVSTASFKYFVIPDTMDGLAEQASSYSDTIAQIVDGFEDDVNSNKATIAATTGNSIVEVTGTSAFILLSGSSADINNPVYNASYKYMVAACVPGDQFTVNATGGNSARPWAFIDSLGNILSVASAGTYSNTLLIAPENASYIIINDSSSSLSYYGELLKTDFNTTVSKIESVNDILEEQLFESQEITGFTANKIIIANPSNQYYGTTYSINGWSISPYIDLTGMSRILITIGVSDVYGDSVGLVFYDSNKAPILTANLRPYGTQKNENYILSVPTNAKYVRTSIHSDTTTYGAFVFKYLESENTIRNIVETNTSDIDVVEAEITDIKSVLTETKSAKNKVEMNLSRYWKANDAHETAYSTKYAYSNSIPVSLSYHLEFNSETYKINVIQWTKNNDAYTYVTSSEKVQTLSLDIKAGECDEFAFNFNLVSGDNITSEDVSAALSALTITETVPVKLVKNKDYIVEESLTANTAKTIADLELNNSCYKITNMSLIAVQIDEVISYSSNKTISFILDPGRSINIFAPDKANRVYLNATVSSDANIKIRIKEGQSTQKAGIEFRSHLGYMAIAPKNTMSAFYYSALAGYKSIILSTKKTLDNIWVVCHDDTIDATSDGSGAIASMTYNDLLQYDFGSWYDVAFTGEKIPTVDSVLQLCSKFGIAPIIRFDWSSGFDALYNLIQKYGLIGKAYMHQGSVSKLAGFYSTYGDKIKYSVFLSTAPSDADIAQVAALNAPIIELHNSIATDELISKIYSAGVKCGVWDANNFTAIKTFITKGVSVFNTDNFSLEGCDF